MHVYKEYGHTVTKEPIQVWDKNGKVSFNRELEPYFVFSGGRHTSKVHYPFLNGLDWQQIYCLTHLTIYFASYEPKSDTYKWKRVKDEPFESKLIRVPGRIVRVWQKICPG